MLRMATPADAPAIARLANAAFVVEAFFKSGDRTHEDEIREMMTHGEFLLAEDEGDPPALLGCVYFAVEEGGGGYFGMLAIDPPRQRCGIGRAMIHAVEEHARARGCREMSIHIVNLREDMLRFYPKFGYVETGTLPFSQPEQATRPCHFIVMTKALP
jgi:GNAT superfamily N-acetyltransferase